MKIAVTSQNGQVFQHFGHTPEFAVFDIVDGSIVGGGILHCGGSGHGALAGLLKEGGVETLICGGIGGGAINALSGFGIKVVGGASGDVRKCVEDYLAGSLETAADFHCGHHGRGGGHSCGSHGGHECGHGHCG